MEDFSVIHVYPQTWTDLDEIWNISEGSRCALTNIAPGVLPKDAKTCFVFVTNTTRTFGHLSCTDFDRFWNKDVNRCAHAYTSKYSAQWILHFPKLTKQLKMDTFDAVFAIRLQLKRHNFGQWGSFRGLIDIPKMCLLSVSFGGERKVWALQTHEDNKFRRNFKFRIYKITNFNVTRRGSHTFRAYIAVCSPRYTATRQLIWIFPDIGWFLLYACWRRRRTRRQVVQLWQRDRASSIGDFEGWVTLRLNFRLKCYVFTPAFMDCYIGEWLYYNYAAKKLYNRLLWCSTTLRLLTQCLRSSIVRFQRSNIAFCSIKRPVHVILIVRIVFRDLDIPYINLLVLTTSSEYFFLLLAGLARWNELRDFKGHFEAKFWVEGLRFAPIHVSVDR